VTVVFKVAKTHPNAPVVVVDPYTFFGLIKEQANGERK